MNQGQKLFKLLYGPNKPEYLYIGSISNQVECNTLAYWAYLKVTKEMKCRPLIYEPGSKIIFFLSQE
jgi:hypothetical protein